MAFCQVCPAGKIFDVQVALADSTTNPCKRCPAGTYRDHNRSDTDADNRCALCGAGRSSTVIGATLSSTCENCAAGKFANQAGLEACADCEAGYYSPNPGSLECAFCAEGKYGDMAGLVWCKNCPAGRYGTRGTQTNMSLACLPCAEGRYGDREGMTTSACAGLCPKGSYSRPAATECRPCPSGRYGDVEGSGIVGYNAMVCTGTCTGVAEGSTCCPR